MTSPFDLAIDGFISHMELSLGSSEHTLRNYASDLSAFRDFLLSEKVEIREIQEINKRVLRSYLGHLSLRPLARRTVLRRIASLRSFFKYLLKVRKIEKNPMEEIETPKSDKQIPKALSYQHVERLLGAPSTQTYLGFRDRAIMELLYSSGLRVSELVGLNRADCRFEEKLIRVRGKGKKERVIPITNEAVSWISRYLEHSERRLNGSKHKKEEDKDAVFLNKWGKRISSRSIDRMFAQYMLVVGIPSDTTPHTIRHTIATHWLENGMDLKTIQLLLGHSSMGATTIYTKVSVRLKQEVYKKAHPAVKRKGGKE